MNRVRVQSWNFKGELIDDTTLDMWSLDEFIQQVYTRFSGGWQLKKVTFEKVKKQV